MRLKEASILILKYIAKLCSVSSQLALVVKTPPANAGDVRDVGSTPGPGRSPGGGNGNLLQYSCLENPMDRGAWRATVQRIGLVRLKWLGMDTHPLYRLLQFTLFRNLWQCLFPHITTNIVQLTIFHNIYLAASALVGSSSLTRGQTWGPRTRRAEMEPLDH